MLALDLIGGPFDSILDVGGNSGDFAETARLTWPNAWLTSFEPLPDLCELQQLRAGNRWQVEEVAISDRRGMAVLNYCANQSAASSLLPFGPVRREHFGIEDRLQPLQVRTALLDDYLDEAVQGALLVKIDVEGHERQVLLGGGRVLEAAETVVIEVQNDPGCFLGAGRPYALDSLLRKRGLYFAGLADCFLSPSGRALQFDAIYQRYPASD